MMIPFEMLTAYHNNRLLSHSLSLSPGFTRSGSVKGKVKYYFSAILTIIFVSERNRILF